MKLGTVWVTTSKFRGMHPTLICNVLHCFILSVCYILLSPLVHSQCKGQVFVQPFLLQKIIYSTLRLKDWLFRFPLSKCNVTWCFYFPWKRRSYWFQPADGNNFHIYFMVLPSVPASNYGNWMPVLDTSETANGALGQPFRKDNVCFFWKVGFCTTVLLCQATMLVKHHCLLFYWRSVNTVPLILFI